MSLLFLSHAGTDTESARRLKNRIEKAPQSKAAGLQVWFDKDDLDPGTPWQDQLAEAIDDKATAFAVYIGSKGVVNWVEAEVRLGLSRAISGGERFPFIPIISKDSAGSSALPGFARQFQGVRDVENDEAEFKKLLAAILEVDAVGSIVVEDEPFFGLQAIDEERSHLFFGRDQEVEALAKALRDETLVLVAGDSGSGKSSLVRAGLIPKWRGGYVGELEGRGPNDDTVWHVVVMRPEANPRRGLAEGVEQAAAALGVGFADRDAMATRARTGDSEQVRRALRCGLDPEKTRTLLVVDQFEELVISTPTDDRQEFSDLLLDLADPKDRSVAVVLTMRSDYTNLLNSTETKALADRLHTDHRMRFLLGRMSDEGLREVITKPLALAGQDPEEADALAKLVLGDVGQRPGDLALVQFALTKTWERKRAGDHDLLQAYAAVGRVEGALAGEAERVLERLAQRVDESVIEAALIRLGRFSTGGLARRGASRPEFDDARWGVLRELADKRGSRLVLLSGGPDGQSRAEIAHEALLTQWTPLHTWLNAAGDDKRLLDHLADRAAEWEAAPDEKKEDRLATGAEREHYSKLAHNHGQWLAPREIEFVKASDRAYRDRLDAEAAARKRERWLTLVAFVIAGIALFAAAGAGYFWDQATRLAASEQEARELAEDALETAEEEAHRADAEAVNARKEATRALINESKALTGLARIALKDERYLEAIQLALAAWPRHADDNRPKLPATLDVLAEAQLQQRQVIPAMRHGDWVNTAVFSANGRRILTASMDGKARVWDAETGKELVVTPRLYNSVKSAVFSADERRILTGSSDGTARLWDAETGKELVVMRHEDGVGSAVFSADGTRILTGSWDDTARLWDAETGKELVVMRHGDSVRSAVFSADGTRILTGSSDGTARLWEAETGKELMVMSHKSEVLSAVFSADGTRILTGSFDGTARVWDAETGKELVVVRHEDRVESAVFSADGTRILTGSFDNTARVWDAGTGKELVVVRHEDRVESAVFSADGTRILTGSWDDTARLWDAETGKELIPAMRHEDWVYSAVFSADGRRILTGSRDGAARLWDAETGKALYHEGDLESAVFSTDGRRILTGSWDDTARLWDAATGKELVVMRHEAPVLSAVFNADGHHVLTGSLDRTARLWDAATGKELVVMRHAGVAMFSADGRRILTSSSDGTARLWDAETGKELVVMRHGDSVRSAVFSADGTRILTGSSDGTARLWEAETGKELMVMSHKSEVLSAVFSADGSRILTSSSDGTARLWDAETGKELMVMRHEHAEVVWSAVFSADERRILTGSNDGTARLWDAETGKELMVIRHEDDVRSAVFSADGRRILTASDDGTARLWDAETGKELVVIRHGDWVNTAVFSTDGRRILTASDDDTARVWDISRFLEGSLFVIACIPWARDGGYDFAAQTGSRLIDELEVSIDDKICETTPPPPDWGSLQ